MRGSLKLFKMKKVFAFAFCFCVLAGWAQRDTVCGFERVNQQNSEGLKKISTAIALQAQKLAAGQYQTASSHLKMIPVVVHVVHNGGVENISAAQIQSQIDVLNEDYGKFTGTAGDGNGVDTEVRFSLAKLDPNGRCTDGIVRIQSTLTTHQTYQRPQLAALSAWDATRYLNIYVVKSINGGSILGYASFPGGPVNEDGIVMAYNYFGRTGAIAGGSSGRTATHEAGHWFGLYHTFNGGCGVDTCADGDYVCDTPPAANPNFGCPTVNSCANDVPNVNDQVQNYMDYSNDGCKSMFSFGQALRMQATLGTQRYNIWQPANITATGCDSGYVSPPCNAVADFTSNGQNICVGNPVQFTNKSMNSPASYTWYFAGGNPATSTSQNVVVTYTAAGSYDVSLVATNVNGSDSVTFASYITVSNPVPGITLPYSEGFETNFFPPNGIVVDNPDAGVTWERDTTAVQYAGLGSARINNLINTNYGQSDALILPTFDLTTFSSPYLSFRWAYAKSDVNYSDELIVLLSTDCGVNFTQIFYRTNTALITGPTQTTPYIPDSNTVWKLCNISLSSYAASDHAIIKIVNVTDGGNNLYIDNINIGASAVGVRDHGVNNDAVLLYPNPAHDQVRIELNNQRFAKGPVAVRVYDVTGNLVHESSGRLKIDVSGLSSGVYFVNVQAGGFTVRKKLLKQ